MGFISKIIVSEVVGAATSFATNAIKNKMSENATTNEVEENISKNGIIKNGRLYLKPTRSKYDYIHENAIEIADELLDAGFENVTLSPIKKLNEGAIKKYGQIHKIMFNGRNEFDESKEIPASSTIVIEYLDFKTITPNTYSNVSYISPGPVKKVKSATEVSNNTSTTTNNTNNLCIHCGFPIQNKNETFCGNCGGKINIPQSSNVVYTKNNNLFCTHCGTPKQNEADTFCTGCGNKFNTTNITTPQNTYLFCTKCGTPKRNANEVFCVNCGNRITEVPTNFTSVSYSTNQICGYCGAPNQNPNAVFCIHCGKEF